MMRRQARWKNARYPDVVQWLVRLDRKQARATFGKRVGKGSVEPIGHPVAVPTPEELKERGARLYSQVKYERRDGKLVVSFREAVLGTSRTPARP